MAPNRPTTSPILRNSPHLLHYVQRTFFPSVSPKIVSTYLPNSFLQTFTPETPLPVPAFIPRPSRKFKYTRRRQRVLCKAVERVGGKVGALLPKSEVTINWEVKRLKESGVGDGRSAIVQAEQVWKRIRRRGGQEKDHDKLIASKGSLVEKRVKDRKEKKRESVMKARAEGRVEDLEGGEKEKKGVTQKPSQKVRRTVGRVDSTWEGRGPYTGRRFLFKGKKEERAFDGKLKMREKALEDARKKLKDLKEGRDKMRHAKRRAIDLPV